MSSSEIEITFIGHATVLLKIGSLYLLTDPNFSSKILHFRHRQRPPGLLAKQLATPSAILVSNARFDHLDIFSYKYFPTTIPVICPLGLGKLIRKFLPNPVTEIPKAGQHQFFSLCIRSHPLSHHQYRLFPWCRRPNHGMILEYQDQRVLFIGACHEGTELKEIAQTGTFDLVLLPLRSDPNHALQGALSPAQFLKVKAELKPKIMIPIRWDSFGCQKNEPELGIQSLIRLIQKENIEGVHVLQPGESLSLPAKV